MFAVIPILLISLIGLAVKLNNPKKYVITEVSKTGENTGICGTWSDIETIKAVSFSIQILLNFRD